MLHPPLPWNKTAKENEKSRNEPKDSRGFGTDETFSRGYGMFRVKWRITDLNSTGPCEKHQGNSRHSLQDQSKLQTNISVNG